MACPDLCTAAKCQELEARLGVLEQTLELLEASFIAHTSEAIPEAHDYTPNVSVKLTDLDDAFGIEVNVDDSFDSDTMYFPQNNSTESNLKIDASFRAEVLTISVADGESSDTAQVTIPLPELDPHVKSNLRINGSFRNNQLNISVADGESSDSANIFIPIDNSPQTVFITEEVYMYCDKLDQKIDDCCQRILLSIEDNRNIIVAELQETENNLKNEIDSAENIINGNIQIVEDYVTVDISGVTSSDYNCEFPVDNAEQIIPTYAQSSFTQVEYQGVGLSGIHENLKIINSNLSAIYSDVCKAIDPISKLTVDDLYRFCDRSGIKRSDFDDTEQGDKNYENAVEAYLNERVAETKYGYLLAQAKDNILITAPNNWITEILADFSLIQSRINNQAICQLETSPTPDVVSLVASERNIPYIKDKVLILHLVKLDDYPKRRSNYITQVQFPAPKDEYVWKNDFEDMRKFNGSVYGELKFKENYRPISGYFLDEDSANAYFDKVLSLINATEDKRYCLPEEYINREIIKQELRPYRAFIVRLNSNGKSECLTKYVPVIEDEE